jgi:hypothetical protein
MTPKRQVMTDGIPTADAYGGVLVNIKGEVLLRKQPIDKLVAKGPRRLNNSSGQPADIML